MRYGEEEGTWLLEIREGIMEVRGDEQWSVLGVLTGQRPGVGLGNILGLGCITGSD